MKKTIKEIKLKTCHTSGCYKEISYTINSNKEPSKIYEKLFDNNHNLICYKHSDGYKEKYTYDKYNNLIRKEDSDNYTEIYEYDENDNIIHYKDNFNEEWWKYTKSGNLSSYQNNKGTRCTWDYDENNRVIHFLISADNGYYHERWFDYDENENIKIYSSPIIDKIVGNE